MLNGYKKQCGCIFENVSEEEKNPDGTVRKIVSYYKIAQRCETHEDENNEVLK